MTPKGSKPASTKRAGRGGDRSPAAGHPAFGREQGNAALRRGVPPPPRRTGHRV